MLNRVLVAIAVVGSLVACGGKRCGEGRISVLYDTECIDGCTIDGQPVPDGMADPTNGCLTCQAANDAAHYTPFTGSSENTECAINQSCFDGGCCTPDCAGKCPGGPDGCGGGCSGTDCAGCCDGPVCHPGNENTECGPQRGSCQPCLGDQICGPQSACCYPAGTRGCSQGSGNTCCSGQCDCKDYDCHCV